MSKSKRTAPINMTADTFREIGHELVDRIAELLDGMHDRKIVEYSDPPGIKRIIDGSATLPEKGSDPKQLVGDTAKMLIDHSLYNGHPKFMGYVTSSPAPIGMLGDMLAAAVNPNVGAFQLSPVATEIEAQTVRWIAELLGFPVDGGGLLVSGGNMANFIGFLCARVNKAKHKIREIGAANPDNSKMCVYASKETHTWIQKAADLFGLGTDAIRWIETDSELRMDMNALEEVVRRDMLNKNIPMLVVGTAGTVSTGAVDPLVQIASFCKEHDIWFHVDGAYGAFAVLDDSVGNDIKALGRADSVAVDPHKWLYAPLEAGCALVREKQHLLDAFSYHPPYYHFDHETINYFDFGLQNSRGFRALKVWLAIKQVGKSGYRQMISEDIELTRKLYDALSNHDELVRYTCSLSIATFRYVPKGLLEKQGEEATEKYLNELNEAILVAFKENGELFLSVAMIGEKFALRSCIVNFRTSQNDIEQIPAMVVEMGRGLDKKMQRELSK